MTPEQMQCTMEFIVEQQAKFATDIQRLFESDKELREADNRLRESQATLTAVLVRLSEIMQEHQREANMRFRELTQTQRATDRRLAELAGAGKATDKRLNVLIHVVEEQLVRRRNGRKRKK